MSDDLTITFDTSRSPAAAFATIVDVPSWWDGDITGTPDAVGTQFEYRHGDVHRSLQRVSEFEPGRRLVWDVIESHLSFVADPAEWTGTRIVFDIAPSADGSTITFTHDGLTPQQECFDACSDAWSHYIAASLRRAIER